MEQIDKNRKVGVESRLLALDKVKKYRPWVVWNFTPVDDKPFG